MLFSTSAIRRYTPPTCTLKIMGKTSPLSRWGARPLFRNLRFELSFDDPRKRVEDQVMLTGDRAQLDCLCEVVSDYVRDFLLDSSLARWSPDGALLLLEERTLLSQLQLDPREGTVRELPLDSQADSLILPASSPFLKSQGLLRHYLFFGNLATPASGAGIDLSVTQLFDLATALDEYGNDFDALPELGEYLLKRQPTPFYWTRVAAGAVLAVGLTTAVIQLQNSSRTPSLTASSERDELTASNAPAIAPLPLPSPPTGIPSPSIPSPLSALNKLPPPRPVTSPLTQNLPSSPSNTTDPTPVMSRPHSQPSGASPIQQPRSPRAPFPLEPLGSVKPSSVPAPAPKITRTNRSTPVPPVSSPTRTAPPPVPTLPTLPPLSSDFRPSNDGRSLDSELSDAAQRTASEGNSEISLNNLLQVSQVRDYFQQKWQPPDDLSEPLEYSLVFKRDGTIERIIPRGQASGIYLARTPMPRLGENFGISTVETEAAPRIRLLLKPDGSVDARVE